MTVSHTVWQVCARSHDHVTSRLADSAVPAARCRDQRTGRRDHRAPGALDRQLGAGRIVRRLLRRVRARLARRDLERESSSPGSRRARSTWRSPPRSISSPRSCCWSSPASASSSTSTRSATCTTIAGYARFFAYLNLFVFSMVMLVLAGNFLLLYVFWEAVGLCSYLLIGFWYTEAVGRRRGQEGVHRQPHRRLRLRPRHHADLDHLRHAELRRGLRGKADASAERRARHLAIALLLFMGACGKSAQLPLYTWLPDAMEGPTPVSALIHAATMVTAGVYMVARCHSCSRWRRWRSRSWPGSATITALFAATIGLAQTDIKRVLAYSTISQLGYMFAAVGRGRLRRGHLPPRHARLLQGAALPRRGQRDPRAGRRAGHAEDGRPRLRMMTTTVDLPRSAASASPACRRWPASSPRTRSWPPRSHAGHRVDLAPPARRRLHDRLLHVPRCSSWPSSARPRMSKEVAAPRPRVARGHDGAAGRAGRRSPWWRASPSASPRRTARAFARFLAPVLPRHEAEHGSAIGLRAPRRLGGGRRSRASRSRWFMYGRRDGARGAASAAPRTWLHALLLNKYYVDEIYDRALRPADLRGAVGGAGARRSTLGVIDGARQRRRARW